MRLTMLAGIIASLSNAMVLSAAASTSYYVDCSTSSNGKGSVDSPFNQLTAASNQQLGPGDSLLFKRNATCQGQLTINDSGSIGSPIVIGAYGKGFDLPVITAGNKTNAVLLNATSHIVIENLELTNPIGNTVRKRGLYIYAADAGNITDITVQNLYINNVRGLMPSTISPFNAANGKYANATGGLVIEAGGNTTSTWFSNILIQNNTIRSVDRQGIYTWTNWCRRPAMASFWDTLCFQPWAPSTGFVVRNNQLYDIGGDGIVVKGYVNALVEHNKLIGFNKRSNSPNAGMWTANSDGSLFQYNRASGGTTTSDGMAYDVDHSTSGTVFQYNLSHDNEGGFFLICPYDKPTQDFIIRYNLSVNDKARGFEICDGALVNGSIYKNTILIGSRITSNLVQESTNASLDVHLVDNIVRKSGSGAVNWQLSDPKFIVDHNAFYGVSSYAYATNTITSPPGLAMPGVRDPKGYFLVSGYPTLGAGIAVSDDASQDFFGNPVASNTKPNIGFYAGPGTNAANTSDLFDSYNIGANSLSGWNSTGNIKIIADPAGDLGNSLQLSGGSSVKRSIFGQKNFRLSVLFWANQTNASFEIDLIGSGKILVSIPFSSSGQFGSLSYTPNEWHLVELDVNTSSLLAQPSLDSQTINSIKYAGIIDSVQFKAEIFADALFVVDDFYIVIA
ncbi:hypothetical protein INT43_000426 [Umbelopsis isabellina]|uniref:Right handed beta helix domain-containing protein n=1 Tax=Mortierella isabellina TaxID=91625 RepID=A0A8H7Q237_MORIS|nr:hypothetical protein INT43_000426 [Umbelopsis isabellina]